MRVPAIAITSLALLAAPSDGRGGPDEGHPVIVGSAKIAAAAPAELDAWIAAAWQRDEAQALGVSMGRVADTLAGPRGTGIPGRFERYHERHRAATRCLPAVQDGYTDRCVNGKAAPTGSCRWMGEATICRVMPKWLVVHGKRSRTFRRRADAVASARAHYLNARARRDRLARAAAADRDRAAGDARRAEAAAHLAERRADPRLGPAALTVARRACVLFKHDAEPYAFGLGMQDPVGQATGLLAARASLSRRLRAAVTDSIDRAKLRPLLRELAPRRDLDALYRSLERAERIAARAGLADCAAR